MWIEFKNFLASVDKRIILYIFFTLPILITLAHVWYVYRRLKNNSSRLTRNAKQILVEQAFKKIQRDMEPPHKNSA